MQSGLLLNIVIGKGSSIFKLFPGENQPLLIRRNALLVLNLGLDIIDGVTGLDFQCNGLSRQGLDEDLHSSTQTKDEMQSRFFLNVVV